MKPFRFGVVAASARTRAEWQARAWRAESLGYATLLVPDHFGDQLGPVAAMMAAAEATTEIRVGSFVLDNDFRHPVVLAKEAATIDVLSEGRFELGLGAGWLRAEYEQAGIPFEQPGVRAGRLEESLRIVKGLWGAEPFSFDGVHYRVAGLDGRPKPLQDPRPPILVGGGARRLLSLAAREADIVGLAPRALPDGGLDVENVTAAGTRRKLGWIREAAGDRFAELELNVLVFTVKVTDDRAAAVDKIARNLNLTPELVTETPHILVGNVDQIVESLVARREELGISYAVVFDEVMDAFAPVVARLAGT